MERPEPNEKVARVLRRTRAESIDREHVRSTIESPGWRVFYERVIKPELDDWRRDLLTRLDMPQDERNGLVRARLLLLEGIARMYRKVGAHVPEWFEKELEETA